MADAKLKIIQVTETPKWVETKPGGGGGRAFCIYYIYADIGEYYIRSDDPEGMKFRDIVLDAVANGTMLTLDYKDEHEENESIARSRRVDAEDPFVSRKYKKHRRLISATKA